MGVGVDLIHGLLNWASNKDLAARVVPSNHHAGLVYCQAEGRGGGRGEASN